jgi:cell wall-associated NlpC family hydrolase
MNMKVEQLRLGELGRIPAAALFLLCFVFIISGCGPKKVRISEPLSGLRANVVRTSFDLIGKTYKIGGRGPDAFDCSGLVYYAYKKAGLTLPATAEEQGRIGVEVSRESILPGDLVVFRIKREFHVGIVINEREFVHASKSRGVAIDDLSLPYWIKYLQGFRSVL